MSDNPGRKVRKPCTSPYHCGRRVHTLATVEEPICQPCRRQLKNLKQNAARRQYERAETTARRRDYWRGYKAGLQAAKRGGVLSPTELSEAEIEALRSLLRDVRYTRDQQGAPSVREMDLRSVAAKLEAALTLRLKAA